MQFYLFNIAFTGLFTSAPTNNILVRPTYGALQVLYCTVLYGTKSGAQRTEGL